MPNEIVARCEDLTVGYGPLIVLRDVSFDIRPQSYVGLVGPNGAGKTTLLKALTGILRPLRGTVTIPPHPSGRPARFGYVAQTTTLDDTYPVTALDVVMMGRVSQAGPFYPLRRSDSDAALEALVKVGMTHRLNWPFCELSRGQQQRVLLARALAGRPDILVLDEPTNFLDLRAQIDFIHTINQMRDEDEMTILIVTHLLQEVAEHADQVLLVQGGKVDVLDSREGISSHLYAAVGATRHDEEEVHGT
jgi:manganese/zinc/iron transport system ATP- binding protein